MNVKIELAYEQHRYFDIRRWMIAPEVIKNVQGIDIRYPYGATEPNYSIIDVQERKWNDKWKCQVLEFLPSCGTVNGSCFIHILRNRLKSRNINDCIHCDRLPCTHDHDCNPCKLCIRKHTGAKCLTSDHFPNAGRI